MHDVWQIVILCCLWRNIIVMYERATTFEIQFG